MSKRKKETVPAPVVQAPPAPVVQAVQTYPVRFVVAPGKSLSCGRKGVLGPGEVVYAEYVGGQERFQALKNRHLIVPQKRKK